MKGRSIAVVLLLLLAAAAAIWFLLKDDAPSAPLPAPAPRTGTVAKVETAPQKPKDRARAGRKWIARGEGEVKGRVLEFGTEKALAGITVTLSAGQPGPDRVVETRTAADGGFHFAGVPDFDDWTLRVAAAAPLAELEQAGVVVVENAVTDLGVLYVTPAYAVPGIVVDESGAPIAGAEVRVLRPQAKAGMFDILRLIRELPRDVPAVDRATSGADGKFALRRTSPGAYDIKVVAAGRQILVENQVLITPDRAKSELRFVMTKGYAVEGRVTRKAGGSVAGISVVAFRQPRDQNLLVLDRSFGMTDEDGKFRIDGLGGGRYVVAATPEGEPFALQDDVDIPATSFIELVIEGDAWLEGRITGKGGAPVAGAQVYVASFNEGRPVVANATTGADGRYVIRGLASGPKEMFLVQAEGYAMWPSDLMSVFSGGASKPLDLVAGKNERDVSLEAGGVVRGVVVSKDDESPIEGVRVQVVSMSSMFGGPRGATTDAQGRFEITGLGLGSGLLTLTKEGWFQPGVDPQSLAMMFMNNEKKADTGKGYVVSIDAAGAAVERTIKLARGSVVRGRVLTPDGKPVAGAQVRLREDGGGGGMFDMLGNFLNASSEPRFSDAEGRFQIAGPQPGKKGRVVATSRDWLDGRSEPFSAGVGQEVEGIDVRMRIGASIEGRVTDTQGRPIDGALVRWVPKRDPNQEADPAAAFTENDNDWSLRWRLESAQPSSCDAEGRYRIEHVETGEIVVQASHAKYLPELRKDLKTDEGRAARFDAKLELGARVAGRVFGADGAPRSGAVVHLDRRREAANFLGWEPGKTATTGADGTFAAEGLEPGDYDVHATAKGAAPSDKLAVKAGTGSEDLTLRLQAAKRLAGVVRSAGKPVARVQVSVSRRTEQPGVPGGEPMTSWDQVGTDQTDADGRWSVEELPAGEYRVAFDAASWGENRPNVRRKSFDGVAAGNEAMETDLEPGLAIRGRVTLEDGSPASSGWVNASLVQTAPGAESGEGTHAWCQIKDGSFELLGLAAGTYQVNVQVENQGSKNFRTEAGAADVQVSIGGGGRVTGIVVDDQGAPVAGAWVNAQADGGESSQGAQTDAEGRFTIRGLDAGTYTVTAWSMGGGKQRSGTATNVAVRVGDTADVQQIRLAAVPTGVPNPGDE